MAQLRLSAMAQADIINLLFWTEQRYGKTARTRYEYLLSAALRDLAADPLRIGTLARPELGPDIRSYHLRNSRKSAGVARPRHLFLYRMREESLVEVGRVLHDAMELERHAALAFRPEP
jgi:toxin ParE1/3/4